MMNLQDDSSYYGGPRPGNLQVTTNNYILPKASFKVIYEYKYANINAAQTVPVQTVLVCNDFCIALFIQTWILHPVCVAWNV